MRNPGYAECLVRAERLLFEGQRVLVDATFHKEGKRQTFLKAAVRCGVPGTMLLCGTEPDTVRQRLEKRQGDASDAGWSVYLQVADHWEEIGGLTKRVLHPISTEGSPGEVLGRTLEVLRQSGLD